jgi:hypothetical protein
LLRYVQQAALFIENWERLMRNIGMLLVILTLPIACAVRLPRAAKELAISALCASPTISEEYTCRSVEIQRIILRSRDSQNADEADSALRHWCVEMKYVDYTGESGSAVVLLKGPTISGGYDLESGPLFDVSCEH